MKKLTVTIPTVQSKRYPIFIGKNLLEQISQLFDLSHYSKIAIITDKTVAKIWLTSLTDNISFPFFTILVPPGEKYKSIETAQAIWSEMMGGKVDRKSLVINLGGGVIGDTGGFAASTYMRGIDFIQIPTSLTAAVDAMVGGKVGINFKGLKNYIGSFQQPAGVLVDVATLKTLPDREYTEAFGEIIKHGAIADKKYFDFVTSKKPLDFSMDELIDIIDGSIRIKAQIVQTDEKESGTRKLLNFGHTIGHAVESISLKSKRSLLHGEAISIGIAAEAKISFIANALPQKDTDKLINALSRAELPVETNAAKIGDVLKTISYDKKNQKNTVNWTLLQSIGHAVYDQKVDETIVRQALKSILI